MASASTEKAEIENLHIPLYKSLYFKLAVAFFICQGLLGLSQLYISSLGWRQMAAEVEQKAHWELAEVIKEKLGGDLEMSGGQDQLERALYSLQRMLPKVDVYLLDKSGKVLARNGSKQFTESRIIDIGPLEIALTQAMPEFPLFGDNPGHHQLKSIFSVARIKIDSKPGYVYAVLESHTMLHLEKFVGQFQFVQIWSYSFLPIALATLVLSILLFQFLTRRLGSLTKTIAKFSRNDFSSRVELKKSDEIGLLSQTINQMADTIERNTEELERRDLLRREMVAAVSHDLRTPLTSIRGFLEILSSSKELSEEKRLEYYRSMAEGVRIQQSLTEDLVELAKLEAKKQQPEFDSFPLLEMVEHLVDSFKPAVENKNLTLQIEEPQSLELVYADPRMIHRVLSNLVENAIRYTPKGGRVCLRVVPGEQEVELSVINSGPAIAEQQLQRLFERFYRGQQKNQSEKGVGLGLLIVKELLELQDCSIQVKSNEQEGTVFSFSLPYAPVASMA